MNNLHLVKLEHNGYNYLQIKVISELLGDYKPQNTEMKMKNHIPGLELVNIGDFPGRSKKGVREDQLETYLHRVKGKLHNGSLKAANLLVDFVQSNDNSLVIDFEKDTETGQLNLPKKIKSGKNAIQKSKEVRKSTRRKSSSRKKEEFIFDRWFGWIEQLFISRSFQIIWCIAAIILQAMQFSDLMLEVWGVANIYTISKSLLIAVAFDMLILFILMQKNELVVQENLSRNQQFELMKLHKQDRFRKGVALAVFCAIWILINLCKVGYITNMDVKQILVSIPLPFALVTTTILFHSKRKKNKLDIPTTPPPTKPIGEGLKNDRGFPRFFIIN